MTHAKDADCTVGPDDVCTGCGVHHGEPCPHCGGRGYHAGSRAPKAVGPIFVTVTADDEPMPIHEETRRAFNAGIRASEAAVRAAARNAGLIFTGDHPHREGDVYTRVWTATDGTVLRAKVERVA